MKKMSISRRIFVLVLALATLLSMGLTGCKSKEDDTTGTPAADGTTAPVNPNAPVLYTITAKTESGLLLSGVTVALTDGSGNVVATGTTDENGQYAVTVAGGEYTLTITEGLKDGYYVLDGQSTTVDGGAFTVMATSSVITSSYPNQPKVYNWGDVMYDFAYVNAQGEEVKLSELLQTKKLVIINFWATWCSPCRNEFPALQKAYEAYGDDVAVIAFSTDDDAAACEAFRAENGYTFDMVPDTLGLYSKMRVLDETTQTYKAPTGIPCSVFVDRYGVVNAAEMKSITSATVWKKEMEFYIGDDYKQTGNSGYEGGEEEEEEREKPNVTMPDSSAIEAAINGSGFNGTYVVGSDDEYVWPWVLSSSGNAIEPSNYGKKDSNAMITTTVNIQKGQVFAFDYEYSIEYDPYGAQIYDLFAVYIDGDIMQKMYTKQDGKVTCYAYSPAETGEYTITLLYNKDSSDDWAYMTDGEEYVRVSNLRMVSVEDMTAAGGGVNVWTPAVSGYQGTAGTTTYKNYIDVVLASDGYYHVGTADGPLLLTKLTGGTRWSDSALDALGYSGYLNIDGVDYSQKINGTGRSLCWLESYSKLGFTPVNEELADLLDLFAEKLGDGANHDKEWLEFCSYYIHYGAGSGVTKVTDVRQGIDRESALDAQLGDNLANVTQTLVPRGNYFKFVPTQTGIYKFYSIAEGGVSSGGTTFSTEAWLWNDQYILDDDGYEVYIDESIEGADQFLLYEPMEAGETYYISVAFSGTEELGSFYFRIEYMGADDPTGQYDMMTACTRQYTADLDTGAIIIWRNYDFQAVLGADGKYYQSVNGTQDTSAHNGVYVDFLNASDMSSMIYYPKDKGYATLEKLITQGYVVVDSDGVGTFVEKQDFFNFASREDLASVREELAAQGVELHDYQAQMEAYLEQAKSGQTSDFTYGYVQADETIVNILNELLYMHGEGAADEWLMFCSFARHP